MELHRSHSPSFMVYGSIPRWYLLRFAWFEYYVQRIILNALVCGSLIFFSIVFLRFMCVYMVHVYIHSAFIFGVVYCSIIWKYYNLPILLIMVIWVFNFWLVQIMLPWTFWAFAGVCVCKSISRMYTRTSGWDCYMVVYCASILLF